MASSGPVERLTQLDIIERDIASALHSAGQSLQELSKDKPIMKQVESHTTNFIQTLKGVEQGLTKQINYLTQVSTGQPHEGSCYAAQKDLQLAYHRMDHVKSRLNDLTEMEKVQGEQMHQRPAAFSKSYSVPGVQMGSHPY